MEEFFDNLCHSMCWSLSSKGILRKINLLTKDSVFQQVFTAKKTSTFAGK
jgi:hypothetical protein